MTQIFESDVEQLVVELLELQGFTYLAPDKQELERSDLGQVVLLERLKKAVDKLNPKILEQAREQAVKQVLNLQSQNLLDNNETFHRMLTEGVDVEYMKDGNVRGEKVWLVDFEKIEDNDFVVCNQFTF